MPQPSEEEEEGEGPPFLTGCWLEVVLSSFPCGFSRGYLDNMAAGLPQREQDRETGRERVLKTEISLFVS